MRGSREGNGHRTPSEAYPNQGVDLDVRAPWRRLSEREARVERSRSLNVRYGDQRTPLGTRVVDLARAGDDMLTVPCGYCGAPLGRCRGTCE